MKISSSAFGDNREIPAEYTCDGDNISPPLIIAEIPEEAKSLALIVDDPDAPIGTFTHWVVWNIDPKTEEISEGEVPEGAIEGINDSGERGYAGPCPPLGTHHYNFHLYALDDTLALTGVAGRGELEEEMEGHIITETTLTALYSREGDGEEPAGELSEDQEE